MPDRKNDRTPMDDSPLPLMEHLIELRRRVIFCLVAVLAGAAAVYRFVPAVLTSLVRPVGRLVFINPTEAFWVNIKLALSLGLYAALPVIFYQIWKFIEKALEEKEKRSVFPFILTAYLLFNIGAVFCYLFIVPLGVRFLLSYSMGILTPMISVNSYLSLVTVMVLSFGIVFELPLIFGLLTRIGVVTPAGLSSYRRLAIVGIFVFAAILTPPDIFTQLSLAVPLLVLYEVGIFVSRAITRKLKQ